MQLRFDFEKQYLEDLHEWTNRLLQPELLLNKLEGSLSDLGQRLYIKGALKSLHELTSLVREGYLCGHSRTGEETARWETNEDGRIWTGSKLITWTLESYGTLKKLLHTLVFSLEQIIRHRKFVLNAFDNYELYIQKEEKNNLFKEGSKLDKKLTEYRSILQREMALRQVVLERFASRNKDIGTKHKLILGEMIKALLDVAHALCFEIPDGKVGRGDFEIKTVYPTTKCDQCLGLPKPEFVTDVKKKQKPKKLKKTFRVRPIICM